MDVHIDITIKGKVQGVGYRYFTNIVASNLNIKGFVKNLVNGDVYVEAEGSTVIINKFINQLKKGPPMARVDRLLKDESQIRGFRLFEIR